MWFVLKFSTTQPLTQDQRPQEHTSVDTMRGTFVAVVEDDIELLRCCDLQVQGTHQFSCNEIVTSPTVNEEKNRITSQLSFQFDGLRMCKVTGLRAQ